MKRAFFLVLFLVLYGCFAFSTNFTVELKGAYLNPSGKDFREIYGSGMTCGGEIGIGVNKSLDFWAGANYFSKKGQLTFSKEGTELNIIPFGGGIRYKILDGTIRPYVGMGVNYYQFKESNPIGEISKGGLGYLGKIGGLLKVARGPMVDLFLEYSYCKLKPADFEINIGGIQAGIGIGYGF
jgi:hypothetical protein